MMAKPRLQATMESLARKRQKEYEEETKWRQRTEYYRNFERKNSQFGQWTSPSYYESSQEQFLKESNEKKHAENVETRREKLRKLLFDEEQAYLAELTSKRCAIPRKRTETPTEVLKEVNVGLKLAEEDKMRHEAELKLYHKWRNENPIVNDYEKNQHRAGVKMAWLDQQIEKRMEKEKVEEETRKMIEERNKLMKAEEELERKESEERANKEKELYKTIETQIKELKLRESESDFLKNEEKEALEKKRFLDELLGARKDDLGRRKRLEIEAYNSKQSKVKLRKKALEIGEALRFERNLIERIQAAQLSEHIADEAKKHQTKETLKSFLQHVRDQQALEEKRQKYISFIFDSEAKSVWDKQEKLWKDEEDKRKRLLDEVLSQIEQQIQEKINKNLAEQKSLLKIREQRLTEIEASELELRKEKEKMEQRKVKRMMELEKQITDKKLLEKERQMEEERKQQEELENIRKEEEKLKNELIQMQRKRYHPARFNRRILW